MQRRGILALLPLLGMFALVPAPAHADPPAGADEVTFDEPPPTADDAPSDEAQATEGEEPADEADGPDREALEQAGPQDDVAPLDDEAGGRAEPEVPYDPDDEPPFVPLDEEQAEIAPHNREIVGVEQEVNELKERVFRSKSTLQLLRELVLEGSNLGSRVVLWHVNRMSGAYAIESVQYFLDGRSIFHRDQGLEGLRELQVMNRSLPPGTHNLQVQMVLRGHGYGLFSYLRSYSFRVRSNYTFRVEDGHVAVVRVIASERGGPWRPFVDRPDVRYEEFAERLREE